MRLERRTYLTRTHGVLNVVHVLATHTALVLWFWLGVALPLVVYLPASVAFALAHQRAMSEWIHEAAHRNFVPDRRWNDWLADLLTGIWFGLPVAQYRASHLAHHDREAFFLPGDADTAFLVVASRHELRRAIVADLVGLTILRQYLRFRTGEPQARATTAHRLATVVGQLLLLGMLATAGRLDAYVLYYTTLVLGYPLLNRLRTYGQHATLAPDGRTELVGSRTSRTTDGGFLDRVFWTSPRLLYHHEHHAEPHLPYRALRRLCTPSPDVNRYASRRWTLLRAIYAGLP